MKMGIDVVMFDIADATWDRLVAELRSMEGWSVAVEIESASRDECGYRSFEAELEAPEIDGAAGCEALSYQLDGPSIEIHQTEVLGAEASVGYVGITTGTRFLTITRCVELPRPEEGRSGHVVSA
jgi:hypothetical protein